MENKKTRLPTRQEYTNITIKTLGNGEVEIRGEISAESVEKYRKKAIQKLGADVSIDGFRKGHIPENILIQRLGDQTILQEIADMSLKDAYPNIVIENDLKVIGRPEVIITKLAPNNPIEFKIKTAVVPEIMLPDYKKIAKDITLKTKGEKIEVTDSDVEAIITQIQKNKWHIDHKDDVDSEKKEPSDAELPPLTDEMVKQLGDFVDIADFKEKLKANILQDKKNKVKGKQRGELGEEIVKGSKVVLPRILVEYEQDKMLSQFKHDVAGMGMPFEEYLKKINKTEENLKTEWETDAEKRAKLQLALNKIAKDENITAPVEEILKEVKQILKQHKNANKENVHVYVATLLTNEKVFTFLEEQK